jgi:uncharacterized membrane protein
MLNKFLNILMAVLAVFIGLYPIQYFFVDQDFGLLQFKSAALLTNTFWNIGFYIHIVPGGIALLIGWLQFNKHIRTKRLTLHRSIGKLYVVTALVSSIAGIFIASFATGGIIAATGFTCLGLVWFFTTYKAFSSIRNKNIEAHKEMMIFSYATCLAAVTFRIWLPLFAFLFHDFIKAYLLVAWLSWVPNLIVAYYIIRRQRIKMNTALEVGAG